MSRSQSQPSDRTGAKSPRDRLGRPPRAPPRKRDCCVRRGKQKRRGAVDPAAPTRPSRSSPTPQLARLLPMRKRQRMFLGAGGMQRPGPIAPGYPRQEELLSREDETALVGQPRGLPIVAWFSPLPKWNRRCISREPTDGGPPPRPPQLVPQQYPTTDGRSATESPNVLANGGVCPRQTGISLRLGQ